MCILITWAFLILVVKEKYITNLILHRSIYADFQNFISGITFLCPLAIKKKIASVLICMFPALAVVISQNNACKHSTWNLSMLPIQR